MLMKASWATLFWDPVLRGGVTERAGFYAHSLQSVFHCISSLVSNFATSSCLFAMVDSKTGRYFCMQLAAAQLAMVLRVLLFCLRNYPHVLVRSSHGWRCIRADVQKPRSFTPLAISMSGLHSQSATQPPSAAFRSLCRWLRQYRTSQKLHPDGFQLRWSDFIVLYTGSGLVL